VTPKEGLEHAWRYFELHAGQRMTSFNFFIVVASLILSGFGGCISTPSLRWVGVFLGAMLALTSIVFFYLDKRTSFLIKHAEEAMVTLEAAAQAPTGAAVVTSERVATAQTKGPTYGACFRTMFLALAVVGVLGAIVCGSLAQ
jgi:hypothetical protein